MSVSQFVFVKLGLLFEGYIANFAAERTLSCVGADVVFYVAELIERPRAVANLALVEHLAAASFVVVDACCGEIIAHDLLWLCPLSSFLL